MSNRVRPKATRMTVCDLCDEEILEGTYPTDVASVTSGYIAHPFAEKTKRAWLHWPQRDKPMTSYEQNRANEAKRVEWDFHAECLVDALRPLVAPPDVEIGSQP